MSVGARLVVGPPDPERVWAWLLRQANAAGYRWDGDGPDDPDGVFTPRAGGAAVTVEQMVEALLRDDAEGRPAGPLGARRSE